jgi:hypothetical protein
MVNGICQSASAVGDIHPIVPQLPASRFLALALITNITAVITAVVH